MNLICFLFLIGSTDSFLCIFTLFLVKRKAAFNLKIYFCLVYKFVEFMFVCFGFFYFVCIVLFLLRTKPIKTTFLMGILQKELLHKQNENALI